MRKESYTIPSQRIWYRCVVAIRLIYRIAPTTRKQERRLPLYYSVRPCAMIEVEAYMACTGKGSLPPRATSRSIRTGWSRACVPPHYHPRASQEALGDVAVSPDICNKNINCAARLEETRKPATSSTTEQRKDGVLHHPFAADMDRVNILHPEQSRVTVQT